MRQKERRLVEYNALITARYDMSATEQNIVCMLLAQLKQDDPLNKIYPIYVKDIEEITTRKVDYQKVRKSARKLLSRIYTFQDRGDTLEVCMISSVRYIHGAGIIKVGISSEVRPYLFDLKKCFTTYGFRMFMSLKSKYAKRIYKMLSQFRSTGIMYISVDELKSRLYLLDRKTGKEQYQQWSTFTAKVLKVAQQEVAEYTDIHFSYEAKKTGRKFTDLVFKIVYVPEQLPLKYGEDPVVIGYHKKLTEEFRLSSWQAHLILAHVPKEAIDRTLYDIRMKRSDDRIRNIGGFTAQTFDNKYQLGLVGDKRSGYQEPEPPRLPARGLGGDRACEKASGYKEQETAALVPLEEMPAFSRELEQPQKQAYVGVGTRFKRRLGLA